MRHHSKQIENVADHTTVAAFTIDDSNLRSDKRKQILKSKSVLKKRKNCFGDGNWTTTFILCLAALPCMIECQFSTRDPRWYSREGDYNYQWPNPGDPEYRWELFYALIKFIVELRPKTLCLRRIEIVNGREVWPKTYRAESLIN